MGAGRRAADELLELAERLLDELDLLAVAGEVAVAERLLGQLEVEVRVVDERGTSPAGGVGPGPGVGARAGVVGLGPGGVGVGDGPGPPPWSRSSWSRASRSVSPQTTVVGDATTIRWNAGNFALVDWR